MNPRVTGIGGIFFRSKDPHALAGWYASHLGLALEAEGEVSIFRWRELDDPQRRGTTVWSVMGEDSDYLGDPGQQFMLNYRVDDLEAVIAALRAEGVKIEMEIIDSDYGRFAWIRDPEDRRIELWQAPPEE